MKQKTLLFSWLLAMLFSIVGASPAWGEEYTYRFNSNAWTSNGAATLNNVSWTLNYSGGTISTYSNTQGMHFGTNNSTCNSVSISTTGISGTITSVEVEASRGSSLVGTLAVSVGGTSFKVNNSNTSALTTSNNSYDFTGSGEGEIVILWTKSSGKGAFYIFNITVTYSTASSDAVAPPSISLASGPFVSSKNVTITCATDGASIYYTTDGSIPTSSSTAYSSPFAISSTTTVKAIAVKAGLDDSAVASQTFTKETVLDGIAALNTATTSTTATAYYVNLTNAQVTFVGTESSKSIAYLNDASAGIFVYNVSMTLNTKFNGVYTITTKKYNDLPEVTAFAVITGEGESEVASAMAPTVMTPSELDAAFTANLGRQIQINGFTVPAGKALTENITLYGTSPYTDVTVGETYTLVGYPYINNTTKTFRVTSATLKPVAPTFDTAEGEFSAAFTLHISAGEGTTIYYTTDGSTPTTSSTAYDAEEGVAILAATTTVKAIAVKGGQSSDVASITFTYNSVAKPNFSIADGTAVYYGTTVTLTTATDDATIYYTTDGSIPTAGSTEYTAPIAIEDDVTIKAITVKGGSSSVSTASYTLKTPDAPEFSVAAGAVARNTVVTITSRTGTTIYYTTDGTDPDKAEDSETNSINVTIDAAKTIRAIAVDGALNMSEEASAAYTIAQVATPTFSVSAGMVTKGSTVELSTETEGATIYYTRDNSTPTTSSSVYSSAITLNYGQTIKAIAVKDNYINSEVASATYTISGGSETLNLTTLSDGNQPTTINGTDVSYTFSVGTGSIYPQYYSSGSALRFYQNNTLTIASTTKTITSIAITYTQNASNMSLVTGQPGIFGSAISSVRTWTGNASSVQFTTSAACRFTTISVTYAATDDRTACATSIDLATKSFAQGDAGTLTATATEDEDLTGDITYTFASDNDEIITVLEDGTFEAIGIGSANVTVTATPAAADLDDYKPVQAEISVNVTGTTTLALSDTEGIEEYGTPIEFSATVAAGYDGVLTAISSNTNVATVSVEGTTITVTSVAVGTATITVTAPATSIYLGTVNRTFTAHFEQPAGKTTAPAAEKTLYEFDFSDNTNWSFPSGSSNKTTSENSYTADGKTITLSGGGSGNGYYFNSDGYLMLGKTGATLTLPAFDKDVTKIDVIMTSGTSGNVNVNIYVGENAVSTGTTGGGTKSFVIAATNQDAGTIYSIKVTNGYNAQITGIKVYTESAITVSLNAYGYATFCSEYPLDFSEAEGYTAWQVTGTSGTTITFEKITGSVKGGTGIFLKGTAGATITLKSTDSENTLSGNMLQGTLAPTYVTTVEGDYTNFGLKGNEFVKINAGTVKTGKAYLPVLTDNLPTGARELSFIFEEGETTGIHSIENEQLTIENGNWYTLGGQKMNGKPAKRGLYIINGKKVVIK